MLFRLCFCMILSLGSCGVIIPEELPSLLSVAYSNIPPIKKGTDSRVGFGFAFGNHADFQVVFELGPQTNTQNLTGQGFQQGNAKRHVNYGTSNKLNRNKEKYQNEATSYLQSWAHKMKQPAPSDEPPMNLEDSVVELVKNEKGEYEIHQPSPAHVSGTVMEHLKRLYGQKKEEAMRLTERKKGESRRSEEQVKKITEDLSNVDLD